MKTRQSDPEGWTRWIVYQRERFPLVHHGLLVAAFSGSAIGFSYLARGATDAPGAGQMAVAFVVGLLFFLLLRIADEFKDYEKDARYRPHRAVPRGLVSRKELGMLGVIAALIQLTVTILLDGSLFPLLALCWAYFGLMSAEFFLGEWLEERLGLYLISHMIILPLIALFLTACEWLPADGQMPTELGAFLAMSFFAGIVIEVGRKVRAPSDEEEGVETYTFAWGRMIALGVWISAILCSAVFAVWTAYHVGFPLLIALFLFLILAPVSGIAVRFLQEPTPKGADRISDLSGLWVLAVYVLVGILPLFLR